VAGVNGGRPPPAGTVGRAVVARAAVGCAVVGHAVVGCAVVGHAGGAEKPDPTGGDDGPAATGGIDEAVAAVAPQRVQKLTPSRNA